MQSSLWPKTKRKRREEAKARRIEEARRNSIGVVFKRLARALHPDLEPDPVERERKGALMQQVTAAHAANDLHTLLRLEVELLHDAADRASLTAETLAAHVAMLKEQVADLEMEQMMLLHDPRYHAVVDVHRIEVPESVDLTTGKICCRVKKVYRTIIRFKGSEIRRG